MGAGSRTAERAARWGAGLVAVLVLGALGLVGAAGVVGGVFGWVDTNSEMVCFALAVLAFSGAAGVWRWMRRE